MPCRIFPTIAGCNPVLVGTERTNLDLLDQLIDIVAAVTGGSAANLRALIKYVEDRPGHDRRYAIDATKIKRELGWAPAHQLETGLERTVRFYVENKEWIANVRSGDYLAWIEKNYGART